MKYYTFGVLSLFLNYAPYTLLLPSCSAQPTPKCYYPNPGKKTIFVDNNAMPCGSDAKICCPMGTKCMANKLCMVENDKYQFGRAFYRSSCTDTNFASDECFQECKLAGKDIGMTECADGTVCCGANNKACCDNRQGLSLLPMPDRPTSTISISKTRTLMRPLSFTTTTSDAATTSSTGPEESSSRTTADNVTISITKTETNFSRSTVTISRSMTIANSSSSSCSVPTSLVTDSSRVSTPTLSPGSPDEDNQDTSFFSEPSFASSDSPTATAEAAPKSNSPSPTTRTAIVVSTVAVSLIFSSILVFVLYRRRKSRSQVRVDFHHRDSAGLMKIPATPSPVPPLETATSVRIDKFSWRNKRYIFPGSAANGGNQAVASNHNDPKLKTLILQKYAYQYSDLDEKQSSESEKTGVYELPAVRTSRLPPPKPYKPYRPPTSSSLAVPNSNMDNAKRPKSHVDVHELQ